MTFREKLQAEYPERVAPRYAGGCSGCPRDYGFESSEPSREACRNLGCEECWNREIPETKKVTTRKTKEELIKELNEAGAKIINLNNQIKDLEKYKALSQAADELKRIQDVFINSGFTPDQAFVMTTTLLTNAINMNK